MHCQTHGASSASCRCHECQSLLCIACWTDHCLDAHGHYPQELDIPLGQEEETQVRATVFSTPRTSGSVSGVQTSRLRGPTTQSPKSRCAPPSPKATERTTSTSSAVIFTPASSHHSDSKHRYADRKQVGRASSTARDSATGRARSKQNLDSILTEYLKDSRQPWSPYNLRSDKQQQDSRGEQNQQRT